MGGVCSGAGGGFWCLQFISYIHMHATFLNQMVSNSLGNYLHNRAKKKVFKKKSQQQEKRQKVLAEP